MGNVSCFVCGIKMQHKIKLSKSLSKIIVSSGKGVCLYYNPSVVIQCALELCDFEMDWMRSNGIKSNRIDKLNSIESKICVMYSVLCAVNYALCENENDENEAKNVHRIVPPIQHSN